MAHPLRLVVGLGNPGSRYRDTRHNAGAWFTERLGADQRAQFRTEPKFHGAVAKADADVRLLIPDTFMNRSGIAVAALARFYRIAPDEILVAHDELDLKPGSIKLKFGGGSAGHNGLKDVNAQLASGDYWRLRIGIGHPRDLQLSEQQVVDYVLHPPARDEQTLVDAAIGRALAVWPAMMAGDMERAMLELHTRAQVAPTQGKVDT